MAVKPKHQPWMPTTYENKHAHAVRALALGKASEDQQKLVLKHIIETVCCTYDMSYRPDSDRDTAFAEGKRYVGNHLVKLLNAPLGDKNPMKPPQES